MAGDFAVGLNKVIVEDAFGEDVGDERVVEAVGNPGNEGVHAEEDAALAKLVELWVAVEEAGGDELVIDAHDERGKDGEEDVVEGESPGFKDDFAGECVLEGILRTND